MLIAVADAVAVHCCCAVADALFFVSYVCSLHLIPNSLHVGFCLLCACGFGVCLAWFGFGNMSYG